MEGPGTRLNSVDVRSSRGVAAGAPWSAQPAPAACAGHQSDSRQDTQRSRSTDTFEASPRQAPPPSADAALQASAARRHYPHSHSDAGAPQGHSGLHPSLSAPDFAVACAQVGQ